MGTDNVIFLIQIITAIIVCAILLLGGILIFMIYKNKKKNMENEENNTENTTKKKTEKKLDPQGRASIKKFIEFDDIVDNMIIRKNRQQYVMVIKCKGVNYDLLSEDEKIAVENGFTQFLNTLKFPVQLYIQTRSLNLKEITDSYKEKVSGIQREIDVLDARIKKVKLSGNRQTLEKLEFERKRKNNVLEYGTDISDYISRMSLNKSVLQQTTYVIVSYYASELGTNISDYSKQELDSMCFNELYTRTQTLISSLATAEVYGRILDSEELAELLYFAYNRDDAEVLNLRKVLDSEYDSLYSTAPDIMKKRIEKLEREIEDQAVTLATESMLEADRIRTLERTKKQRIKARALEVIDEYSDEIDNELLRGTKAQINKYGNEKNIDNEKQEEKVEEKVGEAVNEESNIQPRRGRKKKEA